MKKSIRILDIAQKAGVSIGTVDRVIHQRGEVSEETRDRILKIISDFDLLISSTAVAHNMVMVTENVREFERVEGAEIENWVVREK